MRGFWGGDFFGSGNDKVNVGGVGQEFMEMTR